LGRKYGREKQQQQQKQKQATATAIDQSLRPPGFTPAFGRKVWLVGLAVRPEAEASGYRFVREQSKSKSNSNSNSKNKQRQRQ
jgi:hypothetical protein